MSPAREILLAPAERADLERFGYRVHRGGSTSKVLPPCFGARSSTSTNWIYDARKILRELRFVREEPLRAEAIAALSLLDAGKAYLLWREMLPRGRPPAEVMPLD